MKDDWRRIRSPPAVEPADIFALVSGSLTFVADGNGTRSWGNEFPNFETEFKGELREDSESCEG